MQIWKSANIFVFMKIVEDFTFYIYAHLRYRIYSSERPGRPFNFEFSKGGAYSREALIEYIKETSK